MSLKKFWSVLLNLLIYVVIWYGNFGFCLFAYEKLGALNAGLKQWLDANFFVTFIVACLIGIALIFLAARLKKKTIAEQCGFKKISFKQFLAAAGYGIGIGLFSSCFIGIDFLKNTFPSIPGYFTFLISVNFAFFLLLGALDATFKEMLFRGGIFTELRQNMPVLLAIFIQAVLYACLLFNSDLPTRVYGFCGNFLFAVMFVAIGSLWGSILVAFFCYLSLYGFGNIIIHNQPFFNHNPWLMYLMLAASLIVIVIPFFFLGKKSQVAAQTNTSVG
jgi:membrane protease YdiL (CAAX protease family)